MRLSYIGLSGTVSPRADMDLSLDLGRQPPIYQGGHFGKRRGRRRVADAVVGLQNQPDIPAGFWCS